MPPIDHRGLAAALLLLALQALLAPAAEPWDAWSDTWVATDALGRSLPGHAECGPPRPGKVAGIFYFLWLGQHGTEGPFDVTKILAAGGSSPDWGPPGAFHHWGEPELGYYLSDDELVIRRHCEQLVEAMVDVVFFDVTNGPTYPQVYETLCAVYRRIREEGSPTPQIAFLLHSGATAVAQRLYDDFYAKGLHPELWFRWQGKPLLLAPAAGHGEAVRGFFTFRESWAWSGAGWFGDGRDRWPWLDHHPQKPGWHEPGKPEQIPVCVTQHPTTNIGRSFRQGREPPAAEQRPELGLCFDEQWRRALEVDPQVVFVTGWNEWVAQRFIARAGDAFLGRQVAAGETFFVDQYNQEFSRDIEPMRGGHGDNYYYQLIANVRRFKGVRQPQAPGEPKTIAIDGDFADWQDVRPEYRDTRGDTAHRDHPGWGSAGRYVDRSGRNDIVRARVARDREALYFHAEAAAPLELPAGTGEMALLLDVDRSRGTGWGGYDVRVLCRATAGTTAALERWVDGMWLAVRDVPFRAAGSRLEIAVPRAHLGLASTAPIAIELHWVDGSRLDGSYVDFLASGDHAPNRRANYLYQATDS